MNNTFKTLAGLALVFILNPQFSPCHAGTHVWTGAVNGYWATPGNWENNFAPTNAAETGVFLTTNLANPVWEPYFTVIAEAPSGAISIKDWESSGHPIRFYQLRCNSGIGQ